MSHVNISILNNPQCPIGIVLIIPGMREDIAQYVRFADFLGQNSYSVIGMTYPTNSTNNHDIFIYTATAARKIVKQLKEKYKLPVFVFGHGYGGFIARKLLMSRHLCSGGVCLSGVAKYPHIALRSARNITWILMRLLGPHATAFQTYTKRISYMFIFSMLNHITKLSTRVPTNTPLLIIGGGGHINERMVTALYKNYRTQELHNLTLLLYPGARGNLLFGDNYSDVQSGVLDFLNSFSRN